ncbi:MAG: tetratricopeptide repeat protein [bacterium]
MNLKHITYASLIGLMSLGFFSCTAVERVTTMPDLSARSGDTTSTEFVVAQATVRQLRSELAKHPADTKEMVKLAQVYIQEARVSGKHHEYFPIADRILSRVLGKDPNNFEANVLRAGMMMTRHDFIHAKQTIEKAIERNPYNSGAYGVLCDANVELGNYDEAVKAVDAMMNARPDLRSYARASYLRELHGDRTGAIESMKLAADAGAAGQENRAWALYNLGNIYLNWGKLDTAEYIFKGILEERPNYSFAMSGLAMIESAKGNYSQAIVWLVKASQVQPEHIFIEQLADMYQAMGQKDEAEQFEKKVLDAFELHRADGWSVDREYAVFCLNHNIHLSEAKSLAKKDYTARPNNIDALDTYAWALYKQSSANEALPLIEQALRMNSLSANVHFHAGMIYSKTGNAEKARAELSKIIEGKHFLSPIARQEAKNTLEMLSGKTAELK